MLAALDDYDWKEVFDYAANPTRLANDDTTSTAGFTREDVAEIRASDEGENDGANWIMAGRLNDGRYFFVSAGCDYTGWD